MDNNSTTTPTPPTTRNLDAQLAIRLFGWQWWLVPERGGKAGLWPPGEEPCFPKAERLESDAGRTRFVDWDGGVPRYSTDIRAAFEVALELRRRHWQLDLKTSEGGWTCAAYAPPSMLAVVVTAPEAPEAIARAALKALEAAP